VPGVIISRRGFFVIKAVYTEFANARSRYSVQKSSSATERPTHTHPATPLPRRGFRSGHVSLHVAVRRPSHRTAPRRAAFVDVVVLDTWLAQHRITRRWSSSGASALFGAEAPRRAAVRASRANRYAFHQPARPDKTPIVRCRPAQREAVLDRFLALSTSGSGYGVGGVQ